MGKNSAITVPLPFGVSIWSVTNEPKRIDPQIIVLGKYQGQSLFCALGIRDSVVVGGNNCKHPLGISKNLNISLRIRVYQRLLNSVATMSSNAGSLVIRPMSRQNAFIPVTKSGVIDAS